MVNHPGLRFEERQSVLLRTSRACSTRCRPAPRCSPGCCSARRWPGSRWWGWGWQCGECRWQC